jgi:hypothetical protein
VKKPVRAIVKRVGEAARIIKFDGDWDNLGMDGFLHTPLLLPDLDPAIEFTADLYGEENGKPANFQYNGFNIYGNAVVLAAGRRPHEPKNLSRKQIKRVMRFFEGNEPIPDKINENSTGGNNMKDLIKVLVRRAGQEPTVEVIENTLAAKQKIVGGMIEMPYNPDFPRAYRSSVTMKVNSPTIQSLMCIGAITT